MEQYQQDPDAFFDDAAQYNRVLHALRQTDDDIERGLKLLMDERRELIKHLLTIASGTLVLTVTAVSIALSQKMKLADTSALQRIWGGLGMTILLSLASAWNQIGARSWWVVVFGEVQKQGHAIAKIRSLSEQDAVLGPIIHKAGEVVQRSDRRSTWCLRMALIVFFYAIIEIMRFGMIQFFA